jgi:hypothetical protein
MRNAEIYRFFDFVTLLSEFGIEFYLTHVFSPDGNLYNIRRQQLGYHLRPLYKTITPGVKIFFIANIQNLFQLFYPVKIKMIYGFTGIGLIFIDDGEGRTLNDISGPQQMT